ncbi:hypothetical protein H2204_006540 [Knufia peltigerae]|uniref:Uncharacterized protein n=1 Tax=Knufia peltigerae TaxID=1002370 RepID=A0AA38Y3F8_9EURO|nr:hypothetical protein H2204_006540 [Knufia peltigerae]
MYPEQDGSANINPDSPDWASLLEHAETVDFDHVPTMKFDEVLPPHPPLNFLAQQEEMKTIIRGTNKRPLRADSKQTLRKRAPLHYTVSKDLSKPEDIRRKQHLLAASAVLSSSTEPPRTSASIYRTVPAGAVSDPARTMPPASFYPGSMSSQTSKS